jgi:UV DNA damage endonuclease
MTRLGYCCISLGEYKSQFRTITLSRARALGAEARDRLHEIYTHNLREYVRVLEYNISRGIMVYRVSSDMIPLGDHPEFEGIWAEFRDDPLNWTVPKDQTWNYLEGGERLGAHPGQFVSLGSPNEETRKSSIKNLELHGEIFDRLGIPRSWEGSLNIHLSNGTRNVELLPYFRESLELLSEGVRDRLVFENEDKGFWTWQRILEHFPGYPITMDFHHRNINNLGETLEEMFSLVLPTWGKVRPIMHISEGKAHSLDRTHHDWVLNLPEEIMGDISVDLEIEAKQKDLAVLKLWEKYIGKLQ